MKIKKFNESLSDSFIKVNAVRDDGGHWYIIPNELVSDFYKDAENDDFIDSGEFNSKYGEFRTGGDLNNEQLYIKRK